jgi:predicted LPLAT superfamily acyltransferase
VLVGAHLGSFEAMRAGAEREDFPINIVGHFENARMINALLSELNPRASARVLHVGKDPIGFATQARDCIAAGEMVAILADRVGLNDKQVVVRFMGADAAFPTGPFLLAHALKCPVYLVFGLYFEPNRYELFCEPFAEQLDLPRGDRQNALRAVVQRYAERLEHYARMAPDNWFNFYDFWKPGGE